MNTLPAKVNANLPAHLRNVLTQNVAAELTAGVQSGFPVLSYRGKVWRIRKGGEETNYVDAEGDAMQAVELVLLKSNPQPSKIYYEDAYEEGSTSTPTCWSADGIKPDPGVKVPQNKSCASCKMNEWGSKITPTGSKTKKCADARRIAVVFRHDLETHGADAPKYLMRIPPASLNPLKDYAEKVLQPKGIPYFAVVTRIGFDANVAYPKLTFKAKAFLNEEEFELVNGFRDSEDVRRILAESHEFAEAGTTDDDDVAGTPPAESAPAPAPASKKKAAPKPADDEDVEAEEIAAPAPAPAKRAAAAAPVTPPTPLTEAEDEEEEIAAPAPPPAAKKKAKTAAPAPKVMEAPAPKAASAAPADDDFDSMLNSILQG